MVVLHTPSCDIPQNWFDYENLMVVFVVNYNRSTHIAHYGLCYAHTAIVINYANLSSKLDVFTEPVLLYCVYIGTIWTYCACFSRTVRLLELLLAQHQCSGVRPYTSL